MKLVRCLHTDIDVERVWQEVCSVHHFATFARIKPVHEFAINHRHQLSYTAPTADFDYDAGIGNVSKQVSKSCTVIVDSLLGSYTESILGRYKDYHRWRLVRYNLRSQPTVNDILDQSNLDKVYRIIVPIKCFGATVLVGNQKHEIKLGSSYIVNTSNKRNLEIVDIKYHNNLYIVGEHII